MNIATYDVSSFAELDQCFEEFHRFRGWVYRGQADARWSLVPKIARDPIVEEHAQSAVSKDYISHPVVPVFGSIIGDLPERLLKARTDAVLAIEETSLAKWKRLSYPYLAKRPENDWEWLAVGQHYGLMTRLLDWTENSLAAAFFALSETREASAAIYALRCTQRLNVELAISEFEGLALYSPPRSFDRVIRQDGIFSVSGNPCCDLAGQLDGYAELVRFIIPPDLREILLRKVVSFGVDRSTLFPDLGGVADHINWCLGHPALLAQGDPKLDRVNARAHKRLRTLMASRLPASMSNPAPADSEDSTEE